VDAINKNYHLNAASPMKDHANPTATLANEFDGDSRPHGAARDIGADEISP
jgi:hypothetical protein